MARENSFWSSSKGSRTISTVVSPSHSEVLSGHTCGVVDKVGYPCIEMLKPPYLITTRTSPKNYEKFLKFHQQATAKVGTLLHNVSCFDRVCPEHLTTASTCTLGPVCLEKMNVVFKWSDCSFHSLLLFGNIINASHCLWFVIGKRAFSPAGLRTRNSLPALDR